MKVIVTDLDGTLLTDERKISEFTREVLNRVIEEKKVRLIVASGRDIYSIKELTKDLKVEYYICFNGAKIYTEDKLIYRESIPEDICEDILKTGMGLNLEFSAISKNEIHYTKMDNEYAKLSDKKNELIFFSLKKTEEISKKRFEKIVFKGGDEELERLKKYTKEKYGDEINIFYSGNRVLDVVNKGCSKGIALKEILKNMSISSTDVMAFGDNENDISMLEAVGHPVIMENSRLDLKKEKYNKTVSNNKDGVGKYIEKYFI